MSGIFQHTLKAGPQVLQSPLQGTGTDMQRISDILDSGAPPSELLLYRNPDAFEEVLVSVLLLQFFLKLRRKHSQKLSIAGNERPLRVGGAKHDRVSGSSTDHATSQVPLNGFQVRPGLHELHAQRRKSGACPVAGDREHPCERTLDQHGWLDLIRQKPAELDAPFLVVLFLQDFFRAGELFVARHLVDGRAEIFRTRERRGRRGEIVRSCFLCRAKGRWLGRY